MRDCPLVALMFTDAATGDEIRLDGAAIPLFVPAVGDVLEVDAHVRPGNGTRHQDTPHRLRFRITGRRFLQRRSPFKNYSDQWVGCFDVDELEYLSDGGSTG